MVTGHGKNAGPARALSLDCAPKREEKNGKNRPVVHRDGTVFVGHWHGAWLLHGRGRRWHRSRYACGDSSPRIRNLGGLWGDLSSMAGDEGEPPCARAVLERRQRRGSHDHRRLSVPGPDG